MFSFHGTAAFIIYRPHTRGPLGPIGVTGNDTLKHDVKGDSLLVIEEECPVPLPILVLAFLKAALWFFWIFTARCALPEASLIRWTTLPKTTAVWRELTYWNFAAGS